MLFPLDTSTAFFSPAWLNMAHVLFPRRLFNLLHKFCGFTNISIKSISAPFPQKPLDRSSSPVLQYLRKDLNAWKALCHVEGALREPAVGASRGAAAWRLAPERAVPKRSSPVGRHGFASVIRAGACWSPSECARRREAGWYRGKLVLSSREQNIAPGTFCCLYGSTETR